MGDAELIHTYIFIELMLLIDILSTSCEIGPSDCTEHH